MPRHASPRPSFFLYLVSGVFVGASVALSLPGAGPIRSGPERSGDLDPGRLKLPIPSMQPSYAWSGAFGGPIPFPLAKSSQVRPKPLGANGGFLGVILVWVPDRRLIISPCISHTRAMHIFVMHRLWTLSTSSITHCTAAGISILFHLIHSQKTNIITINIIVVNRKSPSGPERPGKTEGGRKDGGLISSNWQKRSSSIDRCNRATHCTPSAQSAVSDKCRDCAREVLTSEGNIISASSEECGSRYSPGTIKNQFQAVRPPSQGEPNQATAICVRGIVEPSNLDPSVPACPDGGSPVEEPGRIAEVWNDRTNER
ncbi:hypothetical protein B0T13DRAFT_448517 [Neurospora crassa]|nr:hypothetical protein B0T13DRAFT_448517 [Neurospora crassa]